MNRREPLSVLAWALAGLIVALLAASVLLAWLSRAAAFPPEWPSWDSQIVSALGVLPVPILGGLIAARRPHNPYGWLWLGLGFGLGAILSFGNSYATYSFLAAPAALPATDLILSIGGLGWLLGVSMLPFLLLLFPTGWLPSRRWRPVVWISIGASLVSAAAGWAAPGSGTVPVPNPYGVSGSLGAALDAVLQVSAMVLIACVLPAIASLFFRFRGAGEQERRQLKWFAYGAVLFGALLLSDFVWELPGIWEAVKETFFSNILVAAVAIAILRHRLWDIDLVIRRTLLYSALTLSLAGLYFGSVVLLEGLLRRLGGGQSPLVVVLSTLLIAALFTPLRRRLQAFIDRRFYRRRYDVERTLARYADRAREEVDLQRLGETLLGVVDEAMNPATLSLWIREG
jgi:hypothetical protein